MQTRILSGKGKGKLVDRIVPQFDC